MCDNQQNYKDSCQYSVELSKQFITLSSAAVAFIIGLAISAELKSNESVYWSISLFIGSLAVGLIYIMSVVGHINKSKNYDVYHSALKYIAVLQIIFFLVGATILVYVLIGKVQSNNASSQSHNTLEVTINQNQIKHNVPQGSTIKLTLSDKGEFDLDIQTQKKTKSQ